MWKIYIKRSLTCVRAACIELHISHILFEMLTQSIFPIKVAVSRKHVNKSMLFLLEYAISLFFVCKMSILNCKVWKNIEDFISIDFSLHLMMY